MTLPGSVEFEQVNKERVLGLHTRVGNTACGFMFTKIEGAFYGSFLGIMHLLTHIILTYIQMQRRDITQSVELLASFRSSSFSFGSCKEDRKHGPPVHSDWMEERKQF